MTSASKTALYLVIAKLQNKIYHVIAASFFQKYTRKQAIGGYCQFSYEFREQINKAAAGKTPNKRIMLMITLNLNNRTHLFKDTSTVTAENRDYKLQADI